jgi:hypothetical protein
MHNTLKLDDVRERWRASLAEVGDDIEQVTGLVDEALAPARSLEPFDAERDAFEKLATAGKQAVARIRSVVDHIDRLRDEWRTERRFTPEALEGLKEELGARLGQSSTRGAQAWLSELLDAADGGEEAAATVIATADLPWPDKLRAGAARIAEARTGRCLPSSRSRSSRPERWKDGRSS